MKTYKIPPHIIEEEIEGEVVILDLQTGKYYSLNPTGTEIWQMVRQGKNREQIGRYLKETYQLDSATLEEDLDRIFDQLFEAGLVEESE